MDVRLPDGTVITNVPEGTTKSQLLAKLQANGYDTSGFGGATGPESTGILSSLAEGAYSAVRGLGQTAQTIAGGTPEAEAQKRQTIGERGFLEDASFEHPLDTAYNWAQKIAYGTGKSIPEIIAGIGGGTTATAVAPEGGPVSFAVGAGTAAGAVNVAKNIGPFYAEELKNNPDNPDAAFDAALTRAEEEGVLTGIAFGAFEIAPFKSAVKNILFQAFGVQPAVSAATTAIKNVALDRDITEGITPESYAETALGTLGPAAAIHGVIKGYRAAKEKLGGEKPEPPAYRERVESVVKEGYSIEDAETIVQDAERLQDVFSLDHEQALARAKAQWEADHEPSKTEPDREGESGAVDDTGLGAGVPVPSEESSAAGAVGEPTDTGAVRLVSPDTGAGVPGGGEGVGPAALEELLKSRERIRTEAPREFEPSPFEEAITEAPEVITPEVTTPEAELPKVEPATEVTTPEAELPKVEPATEVTAPALSDAYKAAAEAIQQRASTDPQNLITPSFVAKKVGIEIPEAKNLLAQLHTDGVLGSKIGEIGYKQLVKEELPVEVETPEVKPAVKEVSAEGLHDKLDAAYENDLINDEQYREYKQNLTKGKGLPNKVLKLLETEELAVPEPEITPRKIETTVPEVATETRAPRDLTPEEFDTAHKALDRGQSLPPELLSALDIEPRTIPTTKVDQRTGKVSTEGTAVEARTRYLREELNKKQRAQEAAKAPPEDTVTEADTYRDNVTTTLRKLIDDSKISSYEHSAMMNELAKETPNRSNITKLISKFESRTPAEKPAGLLDHIDVNDVSQLILKRLDAKRAAESKFKPQAAKIPVKQGVGNSDNISAAIENNLQRNTPDERGVVSGESIHHPEWVRDALKQNGESGKAVIYSDKDTAVYRTLLDGKPDFAVVRKSPDGRTEVFKDTSAYEYADLAGIPKEQANDIRNAIAEYEGNESNAASINTHGPFNGEGEQVVRSKNVDPKHADLLAGLLDTVNLKGLRVFLYHPEDIAGENRHAYGLHGDKYNHLDLHWDAGTMGLKTPMGDYIGVDEMGGRLGKDFAIGIAKGMSDRLTVETITHELGHVIDDVAFKTASSKTQAAIMAEYKKWYNRSQKMTPESMLRSLKTEEMGKQIEISAEESGRVGAKIGNEHFDDYLRSFPEWWADNVSRWMTTAKEPVSVVDKFFKSVADQFRKLLKTVTGKDFLPNKQVASFMRDMQMKKRDYVADYLSKNEEIDMSDIFSTGYDYSKVSPTIRKAAKNAAEANEKIAEAEEKFRVSVNATDQLGAIEQAIKDRDPKKLGEAYDIYTDSIKGGKGLDAAISVKPTSWLIENIEKQLPSMREVGKLMDLLNGSKDKMQRAFSKMSIDLNGFINKNGETALRETIAFARLLQVRASEWKADTTLAQALAKDDEFVAYKDKAAKATDAKVKSEFEGKADARERFVSRVHDAWTKLGKQEGGQAMYNKLMQFYKDAHNVVHGLLSNDIDAMAGLTAEQKTALKAQADEAFKTISKGEVDSDGIFRRSSVESYFPWRRYGDYWLRIKPAKGPEGFHTFESLADLEKFKRDRAKEMGVPHEGEKAADYFEQGNDIEELRASIRRDAISPILQNMFKIVDAAPSGKGVNVDKIKDELVQLWLLTLPERSVRRQFIHSGDVAGMSMDLLQVFNDTASVYANQIAKLQYGNRIRTQIQAARDAVKPSARSEANLDPKESARLGSYIEAISRRAEDSIVPPPRNELISDANHLVHFYYLSSLSHFIRNLISVPMRILPRMSAKTNPIAATAMFTKYAKMYNVIKFEDANGKLIDPTLDGSKLLKDNPHLADMFRMGRDRAAFSGAGREVIRQDMSRKRSYTKKAFRTLYEVGTFLFNSSERLSRETGFMMQAELNYNKFIKQGKSVEEAKLLAVEDAVEGIASGVGQFSEFERPDIMRERGKLGEVARAVFMFRMWAVAQTKFFLTYANKILIGKGLSVKERLDALHEMTGVLGMAATFGGLFALPAASAVFGTIDLMNKYLVSDDDPEKKKRRAKNPLLADDSEAWFRYVWLPEHFGKVKVPNINGKQVGLDQVITQGPVSAYTGVDIGSKLSYNNLWWRSSGYSPTMVGEVSNFMQNNLGPTMTLGVDFAEAADNFAKGDYLRGVSNMVPSLGKGFVSAYRMEKEGVVTSKGVPIVKKEDISEFAKAANAVGFTPTVVNDAYNRKKLLNEEILRMNTEKQAIRDAFVQAVKDRKDMRPILERARAFNKRYPQPEFMLTMDQFMTSVNNAIKGSTSSMYGVKMQKPEEWMYNQWYLQNRYK